MNQLARSNFAFSELFRPIIWAMAGFLLLIVASYSVAYAFKTSDLQIGVARLVVALSTAGLFASAALLAKILPLDSAFARSVFVALILGVSLAATVCVPRHQGASAHDNESIRLFESSPSSPIIIVPSADPLNKEREKADEIAKRDQRPQSDLGYYYEMRVVQGDSEEGSFSIVRRLCLPGPTMPEVCNLPQDQRARIIVKRR